MRKILRRLKNIVLLVLKQSKWKKRNLHNNLSLRTSNYITLDIDKINCGKKSYGTINVEFYGNEKEKIEIGNYCSIAPDVQFLLGGNHPYNFVSTFPFKTFFYNEKDVAYSKGDIIIQDDVWIGYGATILSGVTLGKGCIIGAKSVVSKDIPPYAIVVGNPAKIVKYRFEEDIIKKLMKLDFKTLNINSQEDLYTVINKDNIDLIFQNLDGKEK